MCFSIKKSMNVVSGLQGGIWRKVSYRNTYAVAGQIVIKT